MAAKKKTNHYYVLVISAEGPVFVTKVNNSDKTAEWDWKEKPLEFDKFWAEDLVIGLNFNMTRAYLVCQKWEMEHQPYRYEDWKIRWQKREKEED